jgi:hypothetical protein
VEPAAHRALRLDQPGLQRLLEQRRAHRPRRRRLPQHLEQRRALHLAAAE